MPKEVKTTLKLQVEGASATPAPPLGPTLSDQGVNIQDFCSQFNDATEERAGEIVPLELTIYQDGSFDFDIKKPLAATMLKKKAGIDTASGEPNRNKVATLSESDIEEIAEEKMSDLNARDLEAAKNIISGTARSMGIKIE